MAIKVNGKLVAGRGGGTGGSSGVSSFNGRTGAVVPQDGDYTAAQVGAIPAQTGTAGKLLGFTDDNVIGPVDVPSNGGDMNTSTYDPTGKAQDIFAYADAIKSSILSSSEEWAFELEDGSTVTKKVVIAP